MRKVATLDVYKRTKSSSPVAEDTEKCIAQFGNAYTMIVHASARARVIAQENKHKITTEHKPTVYALLEIQNGVLTKENAPEIVSKRRLRHK